MKLAIATLLIAPLALLASPAAAKERPEPWTAPYVDCLKPGGDCGKPEPRPCRSREIHDTGKAWRDPETCVPVIAPARPSPPRGGKLRCDDFEECAPMPRRKCELLDECPPRHPERIERLDYEVLPPRDDRF